MSGTLSCGTAMQEEKEASAEEEKEAEEEAKEKQVS